MLSPWPGAILETTPTHISSRSLPARSSGGRGVGGPMTYTDEQTVTRTADGRQYRDVLTVSVTVAAAPRLERLVVTQFGADNVPLRSEELTLREPLPEVCWEAGAAWALVEEETELQLPSR